MNFESAFRVTNAKNVTHSNGQYGTYVQHKCFFRRLDLFFPNTMMYTNTFQIP